MGYLFAQTVRCHVIPFINSVLFQSCIPIFVWQVFEEFIDLQINSKPKFFPLLIIELDLIFSLVYFIHACVQIKVFFCRFLYYYRLVHIFRCPLDHNRVLNILIAFLVGGKAE